MTRRIKRHQDFEISLQIKNESFIQTPREAQRNWVLNRVLKEFSDDLLALDKLAKNFIKGGETIAFDDRKQSSLSPQQIMEDWQIPVMKAMAEAVTDNHGDILEIGFGRGVASDFLQQCGVNSHSIIECNPDVIRECEQWQQSHSYSNIKIIPGMWQDTISALALYDGIFFHTYPLNVEEHMEYVVQSATFTEHFFPTAAAHLKPAGTFSYLSNETDSLSRAHQRLLFKYFSSFTLSRVTELNIPDDTLDAQWSDAMVIIKAVK